MAQKHPHRDADAMATSVWCLTRINGGVAEHLGVYSSDAKAMAEGERVIAQEAGMRQFRAPAWHALPGGEKALIYGRDRQSWHFRVALSVVDGAAC